MPARSFLFLLLIAAVLNLTEIAVPGPSGGRRAGEPNPAGELSRGRPVRNVSEHASRDRDIQDPKQLALRFQRSFADVSTEYLAIQRYCAA